MGNQIRKKEVGKRIQKEKRGNRKEKKIN